MAVKKVDKEKIPQKGKKTTPPPKPKKVAPPPKTKADRILFLSVYDSSGAAIDSQSFAKGDELNIKHSELAKLKNLKRSINYYIRIVGIKPYGNKTEAGITQLYIELLESEYKSIKLSTREYRLEQSVKDELAYSKKPSNHEFEWNKEPNYGQIPKGISVKDHFKKLFERIDKQYSGYLKQFNPSQSWKILEEYAKEKDVFFHCSMKPYQPGDSIRGYWDEKHLKDVYGDSAKVMIHMNLLEEQFEKARPSNKVSRKKCIYAFEKLKDAQSWQKEFGARYVYAVRPEGKFSIHDMAAINHYDLIQADMQEAANYNDDGELDREEQEEFDKRIDQLIKNYWDGKKSYDYSKHTNEVLIDSAAKVIIGVRFN